MMIIGNKRREIKFRVWDKEKKQWYIPAFEAYKGNLHELMITLDGKMIIRTLDENGEDTLIHESLFPDRYLLSQFTGLEDKNGKNIYEGDILSFDGNITADDSMGIEPNGFIYDVNSKHEVIWNDEFAGWVPKFDEDEQWKYKRDTRNLMVTKCCKVIGNRFENPELLNSPD